MPKQAKSSIAKVRQTCQEYLDEFSATPAGDLQCNLCDVLVECDKKFFVESHRKSKQHQGKLETKSKSQSKQTFLHFDRVNFKEQVVSSLLAADIPLHKPNHPSLESPFARMGKVLPSETAARACVAELASQQEEQIQELLSDKKCFLIVDEVEVAKQKYISVLVGSLDAPNQTFLVNCHLLDSGHNDNSSIILLTVDDIMRQLEIKHENFSLFLTDAARYMSSTEKTLKELYPSLMHVTCVAHLLHNCAMRVRAHFKNNDEVIATIKAATIKNKDVEKDFHDAGLPSPPDPVITRWATWLRAALYYSENLPAVRPIVNNWTSAGLLVSRAKDAINVEGLVSDLVKINQYQTLAANVEFLEGSACTITKSYELLKNMQFDDDPCAIEYSINKQLSNSDLETIINCTNLTIDPTIYALSQKAQPTSAAVERSFSMLNKLLRKDRNFDVKNVKKYMMLYYNKTSL